MFFVWSDMSLRVNMSPPYSQAIITTYLIFGGITKKLVAFFDDRDPCNASCELFRRQPHTRFCRNTPSSTSTSSSETPWSSSPCVSRRPSTPSPAREWAPSRSSASETMSSWLPKRSPRASRGFQLCTFYVGSTCNPHVTHQKGESLLVGVMFVKSRRLSGFAWKSSLCFSV